MRTNGWSLRFIIAMLAIACGGNPAAPRPLDLTGFWSGANAAVAIDGHLFNATVSYPCPSYGCTGETTVEQVRLEGTYRNVRTGESIDLISETERRSDGLLAFALFMREDRVSQADVTYATTRLVGHVVDATTIEATLVTDYARSTGVSSNTWTTWSGDSSAVTLHRR
jgi:hypothetical protein